MTAKTDQAHASNAQITATGEMYRLRQFLRDYGDLLLLDETDDINVALGTLDSFSHRIL